MHLHSSVVGTNMEPQEYKLKRQPIRIGAIIGIAPSINTEAKERSALLLLEQRHQYIDRSLLPITN